MTYDHTLRRLLASAPGAATRAAEQAAAFACDCGPGCDCASCGCDCGD